ncbi:MAG: hypothetical protein Tsb0013_05450 [Phycisphaerales bacterium]
MTTTTLALACSLALVPHTLGQTEDAPSLTDDPGWSTTLSLDASHTLAFDADIDGSDASVTTNATRFGVGLEFARPDNRLAFGIGFRGEVADYDFDNADQLVVGLDSDPFDTFLRQRIELTGRYAINDAWGLFGAAGIEAAYESGADFGSAIQGGGTFLATWTNQARDLTLGFGVGGFTRLDDDPIVFPLVSIRWQIDERLRLENERLGLALTYDATDELAFALLGRFDRAEYRLDEHNAAVSEGVLTDNRIALAGRVTWRPDAIDGLSVSLTGGALIYREIQMLDDDAEEIFEDEADPSAFIAVRVRYEF